jgi:hypothetical protein
MFFSDFIHTDIHTNDHILLIYKTRENDDFLLSSKIRASEINLLLKQKTDGTYVSVRYLPTISFFALSFNVPDTL